MLREDNRTSSRKREWEGGAGDGAGGGVNGVAGTEDRDCAGGGAEGRGEGMRGAGRRVGSGENVCGGGGVRDEGECIAQRCGGAGGLSERHEDALETNDSSHGDWVDSIGWAGGGYGGAGGRIAVVGESGRRDG